MGIEEAPANASKLNARQCVWQAVLLYALVFMVIVVLQRAIEVTILAATNWNKPFTYLFEMPKEWTCLGKAVFVVLPLAAYVVGCWSWDVYLLAVGDRLPLKPGRKVWVSLGLIMLTGAVLALTAYSFGVLVFAWIPFQLQSARRKKFDEEHPVADWGVPLLYAALALVLLPHRMTIVLADAIVVLVAVSIAAFLVWDCLYVDMLARLRAHGRLKAGGEYRMQFSLGALMAAVLLASGYVTGLVLIFR